MGCDGGTIPKRSEMIKTKKKKKRDKKQDEILARWFYCALSNHELRRPVVGCELGRVYNKEELITALLDKSSKPESIEHIRGLKDVRELKLTPNKSFDRKALEKAEGYIDYQNSQFICPVLGIEMNGHHGFVFLWSCGCVFSEKALRELESDSCLVCGKPLKKDDVIHLYPEDEKLEAMDANLVRRRTASKADRKRELDTETESKPTMKSRILEDGEIDPPLNGYIDNSSVDCPIKKPKLENSKKKKSKSYPSAPPHKSRATTNSIIVKEVASSVSKYSRVSDNPDASKVYKSLFTSSQKEPPALQSPWITYNPYRL